MKAALPARLSRLRARDLMNREVVTLHPHDSLPEAARRLREANVTGAPVVDPTGRLVGILSATDVMGSEQSAAAPDLAARTELPRTATVEDYMSPRVNTTADDTLLVNLARQMCEGHHHRLIVVDRQQRICGIVSTMDILAALVGCVDEAEAAGS